MCFRDLTLFNVSGALCPNHLCNYYCNYYFIMACFLRRLLQLWYNFRFIFFIIHCTKSLWLYVQDTCNKLLCHRLKVFFNSRYLCFSWLRPAQYFWRSISKRTCNYYAILNDSFNLNLFVYFCDHTPPNVSGDIYPRHLQLLVHG